MNIGNVTGTTALSSITGGAGSVLTSLTGAIGSNWDISEGSYGHNGDQILFHVFKSSVDDFHAAVGSVHDVAGHRKIPIVFPYVDGQSTDDLGRQGEVFEIDILIFGPNYKAQYEDLLTEFNNPTPGTLVHPVRGQITVAVESWDVTHASDKKQAVAMRVRFIEHNFSVDYSNIPIADNVPSALTAAIAFIGQISSLITDVQSLEFVASGTIALVSSLLNSYSSSYSAALSSLNQTFNGGSATIPGLAPVVAGQSANLFNVSTTFSDVFQGTSTVNASQATASQQLTSALSTQQAIDLVSALRTTLEGQIEQIENTENQQGSLIFYDTILTLQNSAVAMQNVLELGIQSSSNQVVTYLTPRDMSAREVCFANGLTPDNQYDIEVLNPQLLSLNQIPKGTIVQVPT